MVKILVVDDEERIRNVIKTYANNEGYQVIEAKDGLEAVSAVEENDISLIILDIMMPNLDGFTALKKIKKIKDVPVIILSARHEEYDKLYGFDLGVDDYVTKPFSLKELMARIKVVLDRNQSSVNTTFKFEGLFIDLDGHVVKVDNERVHLTPKEFELLQYLVLHQGRVVSREQFLSELWSYDYYGDDRTVDTHIKMLRASLGDYRKFIVTVRGIGYKFEVWKKTIKR